MDLDSDVSSYGYVMQLSHTYRALVVAIEAGRVEVYLQWSDSPTDPLPNVEPAVKWIEAEVAQIAST